LGQVFERPFHLDFKAEQFLIGLAAQIYLSRNTATIKRQRPMLSLSRWRERVGVRVG
jgi:hypothetical protein